MLSSLDFMGIVYECDEAVKGTSSTTGKEFMLRSLSVTDKTKASFKVKLWGSVAQDFVFKGPTALALRRVKVDVYEGAKSMTVTPSKLVWVIKIYLIYIPPI